LVKGMPLGLYLAIANPASAPRLLLEWLSILPGDNMRMAWRTIISEQAKEANLHSEFAGTTAEVDADYDGAEVIRKLELLRCPLSKVPILGGPRGGLNSWLLSRYNVNRLYSVVEQLSGHGLLTLHGQSLQGALPMVNIFVHKKASILDTRFAAPTRHIIVDTSRCSTLHYYFDSLAAVDNYWLNFRAIFIYTPVGFTRFWDPSLINFTDSKPPILQVERPDQVVDEGQLPQLPLVTIKNSCQAKLTHEEYSTAPRALLGAGGTHCVLYTFKSPFEEVGYGTNEQGAAVQNKPIYPTPSALRPVLSTNELAFLYGAFEPGVMTTGDGAFWPWTVQLFYKKVPLSPLPPPPALPAWLFRNRIRRFPFRVSEEYEGQSCLGWPFASTESVRSQGSDSRASECGRKQANDESGDSLSPTSTKQLQQDGDSSFDELYSTVPSRKRRLRKNPTITHINRKSNRRDYRLGDRRALDSRDVEIRKSLLCRRASWSKLEDQLLLTCRVASLFLVGHTREYVCVPYVLVRDQLHHYLPIESGDKTSLACARRLKFLLVVRSSDRSCADILLTQVSSNPELISKYNIGRNAWAAIYNRDPEEALQMFRDLVALIIEYFQPELRERARAIQLLNSTSVTVLSSSTQTAMADADSKVQLLDANQSRFTRDWLLISREDLRRKYEFVLLASVSNEFVLPDIGQSRSAIVAEALRNYLLVRQSLVMLANMT
uniref:Protein kinase domain-containing protein n=1 Tax=Schistocephalus solidus TaxID=70667 RepID=A0A183TJZ2_SCHSO